MIFTSSISVRLPVSIPGASAVAAYLMAYPVQMRLFSQEVWAACFGLVAMALYALSMRSPRWRAFDIAAASLALLAALSRETLVFVLLGGLIAAWFAPMQQRRSRIVVWAAAIFAFGALYVGHYMAIAPYLTSEPGGVRLGVGGVRFAAAALVYGTDMFGRSAFWAVLLALLGLVGAVLQRRVQFRWFASFATIAPLVTFAFVSNGAFNWTTGRLVNYWGSGVLPFVYALLPAAFVVFPFARAAASAEAPVVGRVAKAAQGARARGSGGRGARRGS